MCKLSDCCVGNVWEVIEMCDINSVPFGNEAFPCTMYDSYRTWFHIEACRPDRNECARCCSKLISGLA